MKISFFDIISCQGCWDPNGLSADIFKTTTLENDPNILIRGVHTPVTFLGRRGTYHPGQLEYMYLNSLSYHHGGFPKVWWVKIKAFGLFGLLFIARTAGTWPQWRNTIMHARPNGCRPGKPGVNINILSEKTLSQEGFCIRKKSFKILLYIVSIWQWFSNPRMTNSLWWWIQDQFSMMKARVRYRFLERKKKETFFMCKTAFIISSNSNFST